MHKEKKPKEAVEFSGNLVPVEKNLAEFPICALTNQRCFRRIECKETREVNGKMVTTQWIVSGDENEGTPIARDRDLLLGLLRIADQEGFIERNDRNITYTTYHLLRVMKWPIDGPHYILHTESLVRLGGANIRTKNSWWNKKVESFQDNFFHIIEAFRIYGRKTGNQVIDTHLWGFDFNKVTISEKIWKSVKEGYIKRIDWNFYLGLERATSKALYVFLSKRFQNTDRVRLPLESLCFVHLGMLPGYKIIPNLKRQLDYGNQELVEKGFLSSFKYEGQGKDTRITYVKKPQPRSTFIVKREPEQINGARLVKSFISRLGQDRSPAPLEMTFARSLIREMGSKQAKGFVDFALDKVEEKSQHPEIFTYLKIYRPAFEAKVKQERRQRELEEDWRREEQKKREEIKKMDAEDARLDKVFAGLPEEEKDKLREEAREELIRTHKGEPLDKVEKWWLTDFMLAIVIRRMLKERGM